MTAEAGTCSYYISDYADEVCPCDPTLEGWAAWLTKGGTDDGAEFKCWLTLWQDDIVATLLADDSWSFSREVPDGTFLAVRFGAGMGWDCDAIVDSMDALREFLEENHRLGGCDPIEHVAVGLHEGPVMLRYDAKAATLTVVSAIQ